jgi:hypothetical protein
MHKLWQLRRIRAIYTQFHVKALYLTQDNMHSDITISNDPIRTDGMSIILFLPNPRVPHNLVSPFLSKPKR